MGFMTREDSIYCIYISLHKPKDNETNSTWTNYKGDSGGVSVKIALVNCCMLVYGMSVHCGRIVKTR